MMQGSKGHPRTNTVISSSRETNITSAKSLLDCATSTADVSAFCRATLSRLIPSELWGIGQVGEENKNFVTCHVDRFVLARRFESLSLHALSEGLKVLTKRRYQDVISLTKHRSLAFHGLFLRIRSPRSSYHNLISTSVKNYSSSSSTTYSTRY